MDCTIQLCCIEFNLWLAVYNDGYRTAFTVFLSLDLEELLICSELYHNSVCRIVLFLLSVKWFILSKIDKRVENFLLSFSVKMNSRSNQFAGLV